MDEDLAIINNNTRSEKIKNFFIHNKKKLVLLFFFAVLLIISFFVFDGYKENKKVEISNLYNSTIIEYSESNKKNSTDALIYIIKKKDPTYSPLSLYFIIDNLLISDANIINELFEIVIDETPLDKEIKNLIIYKKALYNADNINEIELLKILNPVINSDSVWKGHALFLMGEYFFSENQLFVDILIWKPLLLLHM